MFSGLFKPKFHTKCKSLVKLTKTRVETVKRKKNAVCNYLKNDIADLLKNGLDLNAYGRTEGLLDEKKRLTCYDFLEQFCACVGSNVALLPKTRACPEECREAVSSLIYAAARISEVPELRDLRSLFTERYGNSLEQFVNQEFVESFKTQPPSKEMKLQLMHKIAQEFSIKWDSKSLDQRLYRPPPTEHVERDHGPAVDAADAGQRRPEQKNETFDNANGRTFHGRKSSTDEKNKFLYSSSEDESAKTRESSERDSLRASSSSIGSISEDEQESKKPFYYRFIPAPCTKPRTEKEESIPEENAEPRASPNQEDGSAVEAKPKPRSVRRRFAKPPPDDAMKSSSSEAQQEEIRRTIFGCKGRDEDSLYPLKPPPSMQYRSIKHLKSDSMDKANLMNDDDIYRRQHLRTVSWQPSISSEGHQSKPPDYDELAARVDAFRRK